MGRSVTRKAAYVTFFVEARSAAAVLENVCDTLAAMTKDSRQIALRTWHRGLHGLALAVVLLGSACQQGKTDTERAQEERKAIEKQTKESIALYPYQTLKAVLRSQNEPNRPPELVAIEQHLARSGLFGETNTIPTEDKQTALLQVGQQMLKLRHRMPSFDEDIYPLLWNKLSEAPLPLPAYDNAMEHGGLSFLWLVVGLADQGHGLPFQTFVWYELARAQVKDTSPVWGQYMIRLARGAAFVTRSYSYAAEEELSQVLTALSLPPPQADPWTERLRISPSTLHTILQATGYFLRAFNRIQLHRQEQATQDVETGLRALARLHVDNELTQWGWAFVYAQQGRFAESAHTLRQWAQSPFVEANARKDILQYASDIERLKTSAIPLFTQERALWLLSQTLVARNGGWRALFTKLVGAESAKNLLHSVDWLQESTQQLSGTLDLKPWKDSLQTGNQTLQHQLRSLLSGSFTTKSKE